MITRTTARFQRLRHARLEPMASRSRDKVGQEFLQNPSQNSKTILRSDAVPGYHETYPVQKYSPKVKWDIQAWTETVIAVID